MTTITPAPDRETSIQPAATPGRGSRWGRLIRWIVVAAAGLATLGLGAWWLLLSQIVPKIDQWREPLAQQATSTLGLPVKIGRVTGRADGWSPELTLEEVQFMDAAGRTALRLPRVTARLSPSTLWPASLWRREVHVDKLVLVRPQLDVRRDAQGRVHIAGLTLDPARAASGDSSRATDWLLDQALIQIEQGAVTWTDEQHGGLPLQLAEVDLSLKSRPGLGRRTNEWSLSATPPPEFGQRFSVKARLTQPLWARHGQPAGEQEAAWWVRWFGQPTRPSDWRNWSGQASLDLPHVDVQMLKRHATLPVDVEGGRGRLSSHLTLRHGQPQEVTLDVDLRAVALQLAPTLKPLAFRQVAGRVTAQHQPTQTSVSWQGLRFTMDDGLVWPASQARLQWKHPAAAAPRPGMSISLLPELRGDVWARTTEGRFETDRLDLALLARLADRLPLAQAWRQQLAQLAPEGVGESLTLDWQGPLDAPRRYQAQGRLSRLSWQAAPEHPGLAGADMSFKAHEGGGTATLAIANGWAEFPGAFEEPRIPLNRFKADVAWQIAPARQAGQPPAIQVDVRQASFANEDAEGKLQATWRTGPGTGVGEAGRFPGHLDLEGTLSRAQGTRVWRYLPAGIVADARHYVRDAVRAGQGQNVRFETRGNLWLFPFKDDHGGRFRISVPVKDATLDYVPGHKPPPGAVATAPYWPTFTHLNGTLVFEGHRMRIEDATARLGDVGSGGFALNKVQGRIEDLGSDEPRLSIRGEGSGPLDDLLRYVAVSPVGHWTGQMLGDAQGGGHGSLSLELDIPLNQVENTRLQGQITMADRDQAALRLSPQAPWLQGVRGQVQFTQDMLKVSGRAMVWGQEVQINGTRDAQGVPRFTATGMLSADGLRGATEWPVLARLAQRMAGQTPVTVTVALNRIKPAGPAVAATAFNARPELVVQSSLQGLQLDLPAPLNKPAQAIWPLKLVHRGDDNDGKADALQVDLGGGVALKADYRRTLHAGQVAGVKGALSLAPGPGGTQSPPVPLPTDGVQARVTLPALDLDAWQQLAAALKADPASPAPAGAPAPTSAHTAPADGLEPYLPNNLSLKAGTLTLRQRALKDVTVTLAHPAPQVWRAQIEAQQLAGQIELRPDGASAASRIVARLSRLQVPAAEAEALEEQAAQQMLSPDPVSVPALDIVVDQFDWRGLPLGKLEIEAVNRLNATPGNAPLPEWRLTKFRLGNPDAQLNATGNWAAIGAQQGAGTAGARAALPRHRAAFSFNLDLHNSGNLLSRLGLPQTLKGGKGKMSGQVSWLGSPLEPHAASLSGDVVVSINEGQFLKAEPGVAKLLGVLSLQSLPRRLALDFRDVFQSGFAFDRIEGDVKINQGLATTRNLRMRGVQALVLMEGQADLSRETQNLRVFVVPEINAGTASLAYAAINPAVGLGTFIAQVLLRKAVVEASTREFTITGSWADPQVDKAQRSTIPASALQDAPTGPAAPQAPGVKASQTPS